MHDSVNSAVGDCHRFLQWVCLSSVCSFSYTTREIWWWVTVERCSHPLVIPPLDTHYRRNRLYEHTLLPRAACADQPHGTNNAQRQMLRYDRAMSQALCMSCFFFFPSNEPSVPLSLSENTLRNVSTLKHKSSSNHVSRHLAQTPPISHYVKYFYVVFIWNIWVRNIKTAFSCHCQPVWHFHLKLCNGLARSPHCWLMQTQH